MNLMCSVVYFFLLSERAISRAFVSRTFPLARLIMPTGLDTAFKGFFVHVTLTYVSGHVPTGMTSPYLPNVFLNATSFAVAC